MLIIDCIKCSQSDCKCVYGKYSNQNLFQKFARLVVLKAFSWIKLEALHS